MSQGLPRIERCQSRLSIPKEYANGLGQTSDKLVAAVHWLHGSTPCTALTAVGIPTIWSPEPRAQSPESQEFKPCLSERRGGVAQSRGQMAWMGCRVHPVR